MSGDLGLDWPTEFVRREPATLVRARRDLAEQIAQVQFAQFLLFRQGKCLREYALAGGVHLIGDLPFFVSPDSSDVWANPELFLLDENLRPRFVGGVPAGLFQRAGATLGDPVYTGTHDNATTRGWFEALPEDQRRNVWNYLKRPAGNSDEVAWELIRLAWSSVAALAMAPLEDLLDLGARGPHEPARQRGRQLAVALHRRNVVYAGLRSLARLDHIV